MDVPLELPTRIDALPEYVDWADTGCDLYTSCLNCPLPRCRYDDPGGAPAMLRTGRDEAILRYASQEDVSIDNLAEMFGLSRRTIFRVLKRSRRTLEG
ncbi:MAG: HTH domain-containing protein [Tepidiformaceae bacterium]